MPCSNACPDCSCTAPVVTGAGNLEAIAAAASSAAALLDPQDTAMAVHDKPSYLLKDVTIQAAWPFPTRNVMHVTGDNITVDAVEQIKGEFNVHSTETGRISASDFAGSNVPQPDHAERVNHPLVSDEGQTPVMHGVPTAITLKRVKLQTFLLNLAGGFVGIDFVKKNNEPRTLNGRLGVSRNIKGGSNNVERDDTSYITVWDVQADDGKGGKGAYRTVNLDTVSRVRARGNVYDVID